MARMDHGLRRQHKQLFADIFYQRLLAAAAGKIRAADAAGKKNVAAKKMRRGTGNIKSRAARRVAGHVNGPQSQSGDF